MFWNKLSCLETWFQRVYFRELGNILESGAVGKTVRHDDVLVEVVGAC